MIAAAATSRRFGFATAPAREALGARTATAVWVRGDSTFPDIVSWRQEDGVCEVLGRAESQDQVFRAFLRYLAPQRAVYQTFDRPALNRFAFVQLDAAVVHSLGSGASRFRGYPAVLLSRRQAPSAPLR